MPNTKQTGWVGWVYFAGAMMMLGGGMQAIVGLAAIFKKTFYVVTQHSLLVMNYSAWGWVHLALGLLILCAGAAVLAGNMWGRVVGVFLAVMSGLAQLAFLNAYPVWSVIVLIVDVLVIYALTMHGTEVRE